MPAEGLIGYGSEFWLADETGTLQGMGVVREIDPGAPEWGTADATHFKSPDFTEEMIKTLKSPGTGNFVVTWLPGSPTDLRLKSAYDDRGARAYRIVVPATAGTFASTGDVLVLSKAPAVPLRDIMTCQVNLQFTGTRGEAPGA